MIAMYRADGENQFGFSQVLQKRFECLESGLGALSGAGFGLVYEIGFINPNELATTE